MFRRSLLLAGVAAAALAFVPAPASAQKITLNVATAGDQNMVDYVRDYLGPLFEQQHKGVKVVAVGTGPGDAGSQKIADALASCLESLGGEIMVRRPVRSMRDLPPAPCVLFDLTPRQIVEIAGDELPSGYRRKLSSFRYGPGVFKIDWALGGPIPWRAAECAQAATVHVGGTLEEISASEDAMWRGKHSERPFVIVAQQSLFDRSRAPEGKGSKLIVGPDIKLKGVEITDCDTLVVEGRVEASMDSRVIQIAEQGMFQGTAGIDVAEIHGRFEGELTVRKQLVIHATGKVTGKIRYGKLTIEEGGELSGEVGTLAASDSLARKDQRAKVAGMV